jgi:hypothetical protein
VTAPGDSPPLREPVGPLWRDEPEADPVTRDDFDADSWVNDHEQCEEN